MNGPALVHLAGPDVTFNGVRRQRCQWCGALIEEIPLHLIARALMPGEDPANPEPWTMPIWEGLVGVDGGVRWAVEPERPGKAPAESCFYLDPVVTR